VEAFSKDFSKKVDEALKKSVGTKNKSDIMKAEAVKQEAHVMQVTEEHEKDDLIFNYLHKDQINITGEIDDQRNVVFVNEVKVHIKDSDFVLLLKFVAELKKDNGGWFNPELLPGKYQPISLLRDVLEPGLLCKKLSCKGKRRQIIQNQRRGTGLYRLSVPPYCVIYNKVKLLNHNYPPIKKTAQNLP
jgi:hypothetical protein